MKKVPLAVIGSMILTLSSFGQAKFEFGIKTGINRSNLKTMQM